MLRKYKCLFSLVLEKCFSKVSLDIADVEQIEDYLIAYNQWDFSQEKGFVNRKKGHREETLLNWHNDMSSFINFWGRYQQYR